MFFEFLSCIEDSAVSPDSDDKGDQVLVTLWHKLLTGQPFLILDNFIFSPGIRKEVCSLSPN